MVPESLEENLRRIDDLGGPDAHNHYPWGWAWAGNTPLKRWKRETHEGGVTDPLIVSWPDGLGQPGEVRQQYVHAIDVMPTLLEVIGIDPPRRSAASQQRPLDGASFAVTFARRRRRRARASTQYYEMNGCRAIYHDGWKAVTFHPMVGFGYDGQRSAQAVRRGQVGAVPRRRGLLRDRRPRGDEPERLKQMIDLWWSEAERNQVLPLSNQPGRHGDRRFRRERYEFRAGIGVLPADARPEPAQPRLPHDRRARRAGVRRRRCDRQPTAATPADTPSICRTGASTGRTTSSARRSRPSRARRTARARAGARSG